MKKFYYSETTNDILISVIPQYVPERSSEEHNQYFYSYTIKITNLRLDAFKISKRKWIINEGRGKSYNINGNGIVGETPTLLPNDSFEFTSFCPLHSPHGNMRGQLFIETDSGETFWATVPLFFFSLPKTN